MKKRILSFLLALVIVAGLLPATALTAFAAQYTAVGVSVQSDGVVCDDGWYFLDYPSIYLLYSDNSSTFASSVSPLHTDEECLDYLTSAPVLGEKYYFQVFAYAYSDTDYSVTNSKSSIDVEGFCSGRVEDAYKDGAVYTVTCSIIYGELTGGVKAVASGVEYDSAKGGYAPNFTTLKAVSTEGKELEHTMVDGKYSYYWAKSGCLYKTNSGTSFSNMLTTEPQEGETYYSYFLLNSIDGNLNIEEELVDIRIPGYEVEYLASYGRDMGFTSLVVYSVTKSTPKVYVGGVGMYDGDYLAVGATKTQTTKPSGGYAYYEDGVLTLNNYSYEGKGYQCDYYAVIYTKNDLALELIGANTLTQKDYFNTACIWGEANVSLTGAGILNLKNAAWGIISAYDLSIESGNLNVDACELGIYSWNQEVIINGGSLKIDATKCAVNGRRGIEINGGSGIFRNTQDSVYNVLHAQYGSGPVTIDPSLVVMASTTADGELGEYVAANLANYKKIVINTPGVYVGGVGMYDGDYLAVGATKTQTTKPSGGYAYYKDGVLTLNNYSYEGVGYKYDSDDGYYAVIYTKNDLTLELIGNNTLTQTESESDMIYVDGANLTVGGDGKLTGTAGGYALYANKGITINGGTVELSTYYACILSYGGEVIINDGDITAESESRAGIYSYYGVTVNGGNVTATGGNRAISCELSDNFSVAEGMKIQASTTVDGELGEYVAANHDSYKKIVITTPDVILLGDVTGDGKVNALDAAFVLRYDAGLIGEDRLKLDAADVTGDGKINAQDAAFILRYDAGLLPKFPAEG
ncbi:MAG: carbohydrate-binding domain-containing protein [Clostridia bacterium]|nr:carbohydrate-binding domain-containing protein [Clostridia bacterium]